MLVSTDLPPMIAAQLAPLPMWQVIIFSSSSGLPMQSAARSADIHDGDVPWKP